MPVIFTVIFCALSTLLHAPAFAQFVPNTILPWCEMSITAISPGTWSLSWTSKNASNVFLQGFGTKPTFGSPTVTPAVSQTYKMEAYPIHPATGIGRCQIVLHISDPTTPVPPPPSQPTLSGIFSDLIQLIANAGRLPNDAPILFQPITLLAGALTFLFSPSGVVACCSVAIFTFAYARSNRVILLTAFLIAVGLFEALYFDHYAPPNAMRIPNFFRISVEVSMVVLVLIILTDLFFGLAATLIARFQRRRNQPILTINPDRPHEVVRRTINNTPSPELARHAALATDIQTAIPSTAPPHQIEDRIVDKVLRDRSKAQRYVDDEPRRNVRSSSTYDI